MYKSIQDVDHSKKYPIILTSGRLVEYEGGGDETRSNRIKTVEILVKGQGSGRETAIRSIEGAGLEILSIQDITPVPHNGCRPRKRRRV